LQAFWKASGAVVFAAYPESGQAAEESKESINKEARDRQAKQQAEKEARRVAEETKKRLAVGRIGTI
jgi:hypothetical protein